MAVKAHGSQAPPSDETICTTANLPWLTADRDWVPAGNLRPGERVVRLDGTAATVVALAVRPGVADYDNLTVSQLHTYAVGGDRAVVHNCSTGFFRAAKAGETPSFEPKPNEFKVDPTTGFVKDTHGVSVFDNPSSVRMKGSVPYKVDESSIPDSLRIIQRGSDPHHCEIVPKPGANLTPQEFIHACGGILCVIQSEVTMSSFALALPADFADYEWEVQAKGCFFGARLTTSGRTYLLNFYDAVRLGQEIESEFERGGVFFEPNLVIVRWLTRSEMERAAEHLVQSGQVASLTPEESPHRC